ncbi:DJ-1/PfpI family protein [Rhizobium sp. BE258]|uniref:GlxA family transcriptional regulator n=1 Tax=Rhizobium sp. BE258 TaxID=2817722 RepID=UPI00285C736E|nr:DJ-1/PfpI family protein [Rhizobium sp. BE258]MDR7145039.1 transcriptional regulator GlxA family with amidase domain [Rhizobium sp. BE258]
MLIFDGVQALDVSGPLDVFAEATGFLPDGEGYDVTLIGPTRTPIKASNGMGLVADVDFDSVTGPFDLFLVAGGPALPSASIDERMSACILRLCKVSDTYGSVCTGAFCLGHSGLLDGKRATTHWQNAANLAAKFPLAKVDYDRIFLRDGKLLTSAGVTAGIDLALSVIREHHGGALAVAVAKRLVVVAQRQGGQSQFSPYIEMDFDDASPLASLTKYVMENLAEALTVADLAQVVGMSARTFARAFVDFAKVTPGEFVEKARIDAARHVLEATSHPLKVVAHQCGFGNPKRMRQVFLKRLGVTPAEYRERFNLRPLVEA